MSCYGTHDGAGECVVITRIGANRETISSETFEFADNSGYVSHVVAVAISDMDVVVYMGVNGDTGIGKCLVATWTGNPTALTFTAPYTFSETNQVSSHEYRECRGKRSDRCVLQCRTVRSDQHGRERRRDLDGVLAVLDSLLIRTLQAHFRLILPQLR